MYYIIFFLFLVIIISISTSIFYNISFKLHISICNNFIYYFFHPSCRPLPPFPHQGHSNLHHVPDDIYFLHHSEIFYILAVSHNRISFCILLQFFLRYFYIIFLRIDRCLREKQRKNSLIKSAAVKIQTRDFCGQK